MLQILAGMLEAEAHVGVGGEMKNGVATGHRLRQCGQIQIVAFDELEVGIFQRAFQKSSLASRKIIPADDGFAVGQEPVNKVAADEARRAGHENFFH